MQLMIARNAQTIIAIAAVLTFLVIALVPAASGLYWLVQLNGKVDYLQAELEDTQQDMRNLQQDVQDTRREVADTRQEIADTRQELLSAIEQSENRILEALVNHRHDEQGNAVFTRLVRASAQPGKPTSPPRQ